MEGVGWNAVEPPGYTTKRAYKGAMRQTKRTKQEERQENTQEQEEEQEEEDMDAVWVRPFKKSKVSVPE